jgi:hypothetical protein
MTERVVTDRCHVHGGLPVWIIKMHVQLCLLRSGKQDTMWAGEGRPWAEGLQP